MDLERDGRFTENAFGSEIDRICHDLDLEE